MNSWRVILIACAVAAAPAASLAGRAAASDDVPRPGLPPGDACRAGFGPGAFGGYLPMGEATPGKSTSVDLIWESGKLAGPRVAEAIACVSINDELAERLATSLGTVDNDGRQPHTFTVPADTPPGAKVCQRGLVLGRNLEAEPVAVRTNPVCFTVAEGRAARAAGGASRATDSVGPGSAARRAATTAAPEVTQPPATTITASAPGPLPRTGIGRHLSVLAGLLLLLGGAAVMAGRRRLVSK